MKKFASATLHFVVLNILWMTIRTLMYSYRYSYTGTAHFIKAKTDGSFIFAIWHECMIGFLSAHAWTHPYLTLASKSKDGDYAAFVSSHMGFTPVRGSSRRKNQDKGGKEAMDEYVQKLGEGISGGITVDGPKGPRHVCKMGIARIAQKSGRPIIPGIAVASSCWTLKSWDQFKIPKPFSKISIFYGAPIWVKEDATEEELNLVCLAINESLEYLEHSRPSNQILLKAS